MSEDDKRAPSGADEATEPLQKPKKVTIKTSAVTEESQSQLYYTEDDQEEAEEEGQAQQPRRARPPAPWSKSEPLTKIHSLLGHMVQGDVYRNELDLIYDRIQGDAEAPEYISAENGESPDTEPLPSTTDPFADGSFDFGMSVGEISVSTEGSVSEEITFDEAAGERPVNPQASSILGEINMDDFDELHQTARTSIGLTPEEIKAQLKPQEKIDDALMDSIATAPESWSESDIDPSLMKRPRGESTDFSFFESSHAVNVEVIQGSDTSGGADSLKAESTSVNEPRHLSGEALSPQDTHVDQEDE